jgi:hypothetical protein
MGNSLYHTGHAFKTTMDAVFKNAGGQSGSLEASLRSEMRGFAHSLPLLLHHDFITRYATMPHIDCQVIPFQSAGITKKYTVKEGDNLSDICKHLGGKVTVEQIKLWNRLKNNTIQPGQILIVGFPKYDVRITLQYQQHYSEILHPDLLSTMPGIANSPQVVQPYAAQSIWGDPSRGVDNLSLVSLAEIPSRLETPMLENLGVAGYVSHGMIGSAATLTAKNTYRYGKRINGVVKSAAQLTAENAALWEKVAFRFNIVGGTLGAGVNGYKAIDEYESGEKGWAAFHGSVALGYTAGVIITILCPECGYGEYLLISTMAADIAGEGVKVHNEH